MITLNNLSMGFSQRTLFKDVTLSIFPKEKIGLTGPNGAGKTTLFNIILGEMESVKGDVQRQKNISIGYLPQEAQFESDRTVMDEIIYGDKRLKNLIDEREKLENEGRAGEMRYGDVLEQLEQLGIYDLEHKAEKILVGLGFKEDDFYRPILHLSGGWQMRVLLAKLLTHSYDLLLLDEPTNYLDLGATLWLKDFLKNYQSSFVLISHDRVFLNDVTNYTIVLDMGSMTKVKGNYDNYMTQKEVEQKTLEKQQKVVEKKRAQLERFAQRFHAQPNRASAVKNKQKMIDKLETIELDHYRSSMGEFEFGDIPSSGYVVSALRGVSKSYGEKNVYSDLDLEIIKGQKICLVGPNGAGKSTLLKMLAGAIEHDEGEIKLGHDVTQGYFSQTRLDVLSPNRNVFEEVYSACPGSMPQTKIRTLLGLFNFHGDDVFKPISVLSGGEKSRVILAKLLIYPPNFMLLDEPTTHLDLDGIKSLTKAFQKYTGTMCFISHDLFFIREVADCIIEVDDGQIKNYPGGLDYYLDKKAEGSEEKLAATQKIGDTHKKKNNPPKEQKTSKSDNQISQDERKQIKAQVLKLLKEIEKLEKEDKDLDNEHYAKSRKLAEANAGLDQNMLKSYGKRLKEIDSRREEIEIEMLEMMEKKENLERKL